MQDKGEIDHFLKYLMKDVCYVKGAALTIFSLINTYSNYAFLHPYFKKICKELPHFPSFDLVYVLILLHKYSRIYFNENLYKVTKSQDLELFLNACEKLLRSMHTEIIIEIGNIFLDFPSDDRISKVFNNFL